MEARMRRTTLLVLILTASMGASYRTKNFIVNAPSAAFAKQVGDMAEAYRRELAIAWLGKAMQNWAEPCPIRVEPGGGAGGATSFMFHQGEVFGWQMQIQGSPERILDSVLPHEVTHTVFATHFRQPLPRWADEGACTTVEHESERMKQQRMLVQFLRTGRGIAFNRMFAMKEYPSDIMPLYSQGHSLASFLLHQGGRQKFMQYVKDGLDANGAWSKVTANHYGFNDLGHLQQTWLEWVRQGSPSPIPLAMLPKGNDPNIALAQATQERSAGGVTVRGQSVDPEPQAGDAAGPSVYKRRGPVAMPVSQSVRADRTAESTSGNDRRLVPIVKPGDSASPAVETASDMTLSASPALGENARVATSDSKFRSPSSSLSDRELEVPSRPAPEVPLPASLSPPAATRRSAEATADRVPAPAERTVLAEWNRNADGTDPPETKSLDGELWDARTPETPGATIRR